MGEDSFLMNTDDDSLRIANLQIELALLHNTNENIEIALREEKEINENLNRIIIDLKTGSSQSSPRLIVPCDFKKVAEYCRIVKYHTNYLHSIHEKEKVLGNRKVEESELLDSLIDNFEKLEEYITDLGVAWTSNTKKITDQGS